MLPIAHCGKFRGGSRVIWGSRGRQGPTGPAGALWLYCFTHRPLAPKLTMTDPF